MYFVVGISEFKYVVWAKLVSKFMPGAKLH